MILFDHNYVCVSGTIIVSLWISGGGLQPTFKAIRRNNGNWCFQKLTINLFLFLI